VATPEFVQAAAVRAWEDDAHAAEMRALYRAKWTLLRDALASRDVHVAPGEPGFFLFFRPPTGDSVDECVGRLLDHGILVVPGERFGPGGTGWIRMALVPTLDECENAARILRAEL
jgi:aspartate/methionine/tyrosine aminotransferase